jgi:hypothetical protein
MNSKYLHPSYAGRVSEPTERTSAEPSAPGLDLRALRLAGRSCCCTARPAVVVLMPPSAGRPHATDLLMCMHHYMASRERLAAAGATVADATGQIL